MTAPEPRLQKRISAVRPDGPSASSAILRPFLRISVAPNAWIHRVLPEALNPLTNTGAIANMLLIIAVISGILLLFWYTPSVGQAYASLEGMKSSTLPQLVRSIHRYSSDACMLFILIHALKCFLGQKFTGARWIAWATGLFALAVLWVEGLTGYWLVWDVRARQIAIGTGKLMDLIPIFDEPMSRSFLTNEHLNSFLFFVVFFFHMLLPLLMVAALWLHISRLNKPNFLTGRTLTIWIILTLVVVSLVKPAVNAEAADMATVPGFFTMDWWYLFPLYLIERLSAGVYWAGSFVVAVVLYSMPWWRRRSKTVTVNPALCDGCTHCYRDCPYNAISMISRGEGKNALSSVDASLCTGCGICTASCPTLAITLPHYSLRDMRLDLDRWLNESKKAGQPFLPAFICSSSAGMTFQYDVKSGLCPSLPGYRVMPVPCAGWVHARIVERLLRLGAHGVLIAGCGPGECSFRQGAEITDLRLQAKLDPEFRADRAGTNNVNFLQLDGLNPGVLQKRAAEFRKSAIESSAWTSAQYGAPRSKIAATALGLLLAAFFGAVTWVGSDWAYTTPFNGDPLLVVSFHHPGTTGENCRTLSNEELASRPVHMRAQSNAVCERKRYPVRMRVLVDGTESIASAYRPSGLWQDGASLAIENIPVKAGKHTVKIQIGDTANAQEWAYDVEKEVEFSRWKRRVVLFDRTKGFTWH